MIFCWGGAGDGGTGSLSSCSPLLLVRVLGEFSVSEAEKLVSPDSPRPRGRLSCEYLIRAGSVMERAPEPRAAARQLQVWGARVSVSRVRGGPGPAS